MPRKLDHYSEIQMHMLLLLSLLLPAAAAAGVVEVIVTIMTLIQHKFRDAANVLMHVSIKQKCFKQ